MAYFEKHIIFRVSTKSVDNIILSPIDWRRTKQIWNRKEVNRYLFRIKDEYEWFDCNEEIGERLTQFVKEHNKNNELTVLLYQVDPSKPIPQKKFSKMWRKFKSFFDLKK